MNVLSGEITTSVDFSDSRDSLKDFGGWTVNKGVKYSPERR